VVTDMPTPVAVLVAVTFALGTTAPWGSTTCPTMVAVDALCANAGTAARQKHKSGTHRKAKRFIGEFSFSCLVILFSHFKTDWLKSGRFLATSNPVLLGRPEFYAALQSFTK
jgi:hypothetical protein